MKSGASGVARLVSLDGHVIVLLKYIDMLCKELDGPRSPLATPLSGAGLQQCLSLSQGDRCNVP